VAPFCLAFALLFVLNSALAQPFQLPTANHALFEPDGEPRFFVGTAGKSWSSGCFGCVRSDGWQMHEGLDIRCLQRDKRGEPIDPVLATADGTVAYLNSRSALSNYGKYVVLRHRVEGVEIYSLYAHLSRFADGLRVGQEVKAGETIAIMGRTSNTREGISRDRAHVHFELNLLLNDRFSDWFKQMSPKERNDHGDLNGQNLVGLDARLVLLAAHDQGDRFNLLNFIWNQPELCRVIVRKTDFPWLKRYAGLIRPDPAAEKEGIAAYEIALNFNGVPFELVPRTESELNTSKLGVKGKARYRLLSVNEAEYHKNPCRKLVVQKGSRWELAPRGINLLDLLTY
jgi:peptidoglycan LD-endopeptidase LytH